MAKRNEACWRCKFWQRYINTSHLGFKAPERWGGCYRKAPALWIDEEGVHRNAFPATHGGQWCGEFEVSPYVDYRTSLRDLDLTSPQSAEGLRSGPLSDDRVKRVIDALESAGIYSISDWLMVGESQLLMIPEVGRKALHVVKNAISQEISDGLVTTATRSESVEFASR